MVGIGLVGDVEKKLGEGVDWGFGLVSLVLMSLEVLLLFLTVSLFVRLVVVFGGGGEGWEFCFVLFCFVLFCCFFGGFVWRGLLMVVILFSDIIQSIIQS